MDNLKPLTLEERARIHQEYMAKTKVTPVQLLKVPNSLIGKLFIWYFRRHLNRVTYEMRCRGRKPKKSAKKSWGFVPLKDAREVGIYVDYKSTSGYKLNLKENYRWR